MGAAIAAQSGTGVGTIVSRCGAGAGAGAASSHITSHVGAVSGAGASLKWINSRSQRRIILSTGGRSKIRNRIKMMRLPTIQHIIISNVAFPNTSNFSTITYIVIHNLGNIQKKCCSWCYDEHWIAMCWCSIKLQRSSLLSLLYVILYGLRFKIRICYTNCHFITNHVLESNMFSWFFFLFRNVFAVLISVAEMHHL
jgi:hypothetical protein